jgi:hypothetical protein
MERHAEHNWLQFRVLNRLRQVNNGESVMRLQQYLAALQQPACTGCCHWHQWCTQSITDKNWAGHSTILDNDDAIRPRKEACSPKGGVSFF